MGFGITRRARSIRGRGRGLRALLGGKPPDASEVGERLVRLAGRMFRGEVIDASPRRVTLGLHPAASPARIAVLPDGALELRAETAAIGPGYHAEVIARVAPLLEELEYAWEPAAAAAAGADDHADDTGAGREDAPPGPRMLAWLAAELAAGATRVGMPAQRSFLVDAAVQTALGPRDAAWRDAVIADPARGADAFAWWERAPGHAERSRALLALWHEVPWREPLDDDERALGERVDADLRAARRAAPGLALPWAAWAELLEHLGADDAHAADVRARAREAGGDAPPLGYRRYPMEVELSGGWTLALGGAFVGRWEDDGARWWSTDGERAVEFTSLTADGETDSDRLLAVAAEAHPVVERVRDGDRRGRAEVSDEGDVRVVHGLMVRAPHVAILTCRGRASDEAWGLATWRSLRNA